METERVRCRKCRKILLSKDEFCLLDAHGEEYHDTVGSDVKESECDCLSVKERSCLYLSEESFPDFILHSVDESSWTKGKIHCPACSARLGSFNFVSGSQCACGSHVLPQVHILRSKVDWMKVDDALPRPVSYPNHSVSLCASTLPLDDATPVTRDECSERREEDGSDSPRSFTDLSLTVTTTTTSQADCNAFRSQEKEINLCQRSSQRGRCSRQNRRAGPCYSDNQSSIAPTVRMSHFEVLADEVTTTEPEDDSSPEEEEAVPEKLVCPVCLDILYSPLVTRPCGHTFCEPCLRRLARPNPNNTLCPLCRLTIGQCMPCPELACKVRKNHPSLYKKRRQFELQHNSQHLPLPWIRNFRLRNTPNGGHNWVERAGGWRTVVLVLSLNILGIGIFLYLGRPVKNAQDFYLHVAS